MVLEGTARTIYRQIGIYAKIVTGANSFVATERGLAFRVNVGPKMKKGRGIYKIEITRDRGDSYIVKLLRVEMATRANGYRIVLETVKDARGVYAGELGTIVMDYAGW